jgi:hypothetical protein
MGRSIPSFRQLLEIERLNWSSFKKRLPTKKDRQEFDKVFDNVSLYTSYLENASNPIPLESVFMGAIFHNYKQILQITKDEDTTIYEDSLKKKNLYLYLIVNLKGRFCFIDIVKRGMVSYILP